jgi:chromosome segregation ATPase
MPLFAFRRVFGSRWHDFNRLLWPTSPREDVQSELDRLDEELRRRQARLLRSRQLIEKLRDEVEKMERRLEALAARLSNEPARARLVEKLERGRRTLDRQRVRLHGRESAYDRLRARFQQQKQMRSELNNLLLSSSRLRTVRNNADENDCDYPF